MQLPRKGPRCSRALGVRARRDRKQTGRGLEQRVVTHEHGYVVILAAESIAGVINENEKSDSAKVDILNVG